MNAIASFRKCTLSDDELLKEVNDRTDAMFTDLKIPSMHVPARPNEDYDLLIGELLLRFKEQKEEMTRLRSDRKEDMRKAWQNCDLWFKPGNADWDDEELNAAFEEWYTENFEHGKDKTI